MRAFLLKRNVDVSGVSGTGVVAEGVEFEDGKIAICWLGTYHSVEVIDNMHVLEKTHGHDGKTVVVWV